MKHHMIEIFAILLCIVLTSCNESSTEPLLLKAGKPTIHTSDTENGSNIVLSCSTSDAEIYFTLDGTEPTQNSYKYTRSFHLGHSSIFKARAFYPGYEQSDLAEKSISVTNENLLNNLYGEDETDIIISISSEERIIYANSNLGADNISQFNWSLSVNGNNVDYHMENGGYEEADRACWSLPNTSNDFTEGSTIYLELTYTYTKNGTTESKTVNGSVTNAHRLRNVTKVDELNTIQFNWETNGYNDIIYLINITNGATVYTDYIPSNLNQIIITNPNLSGYYRLESFNYKKYGRNVIMSFANGQELKKIRRRK